MINKYLFLTLFWFTTLLSTTHTTAGLEPQIHDDGSGPRLDLLEAVGLFGHIGNFSMRHEGVVLRPGPHSPAPAALFMSSLPSSTQPRKIKVDLRSASLLSTWSQAKHSELALMASLRQWEGNAGTLLSLVKGSQTLLEIQSSGRRQGHLRLIYRALSSSSSSSEMSMQAVETLAVNLADNQWHKLAVTLSGNQLQVFLDCQSIHTRIIRPLDFRIWNSTEDESENFALWVGQQSEQRFLYKGYIQNLFVVPGPNGHRLQCPSTKDLACPTCGEFRGLQDVVQSMQDQYLKQIQLLEQRLQATEDRLSKVEECDCHKSCRLPGGLIREDGASWSDQCQLCSCVRGVVTCRPPTCPTLNCTDPNPPDPTRGICCPTCKDECRQFVGQSHPHGSIFSPKPCTACQCNNGHLNCTTKDPAKDCPKLDCPLEEQTRDGEKCCQTCRGDFCSRGHDCHSELAVCVNGLLNYTCHCREGFKGNGTTCEDQNECEQLGGQGGHFCTQANSICVNTFGSYRCECAEGFQMGDEDSSCTPINQCLLNTSPCHSNATCNFLGPGTFQCICNQGFAGNGTHCYPVCEAGCENGGICDGPNHCACPSGFEGSKCQVDIDECALGPGVHQCSSDSICVNKPGWHYCECRPGFRAYQDPVVGGATICIDENECDLGTHTCHPTAQCWNTGGSYQCYCGSNNAQCSTSCVEDGVEHQDGSQWREGCSECQCLNGVTSCQALSCSNCSIMTDNKEARNCCPQCLSGNDVEPRKCHLLSDHQGLQEYHNGQKWLSQCQECECLNGEIDCWPLECPPVFCPHPILRPGHCCPQCLDGVEGHHLGGLVLDKGCRNTSSSSCSHMGREYKSGQSWALVESKCTSCQCRVPYCDERVSREAASASATASLSKSSAAVAVSCSSQNSFLRMAVSFALIALHASQMSLPMGMMTMIKPL